MPWLPEQPTGGVAATAGRAGHQRRAVRVEIRLVVRQASVPAPTSATRVRASASTCTVGSSTRSSTIMMKVANEQRIAGEDANRTVVIFLVREHEGEVVIGMAWRLQHLDDKLANLVSVSFPRRFGRSDFAVCIWAMQNPRACHRGKHRHA